MITSSKNYAKINIKIRNKSVADNNPQVYSCSQSPPPQFWDDSLSIQLFHRCRVPHVDFGAFNPLLLRLHGEISLSLLCSHSSRGSALDLDPPLQVGRLRASLLRSDRTGLKEELIRGLWLPQAGGEGGVQMQGEPEAAEASVTLPQPEACRAFSRGSCPWITGPWQWRAAQAPGRGGVESDLCLHTGFLVVAAAALAFHARLCGPS